MKNRYDIAQLFIRLALGFGFLLPVLDRIGLLGAAGTNGNVWGNWENFGIYTHSLMPYMSKPISAIFAILATIGELVIGIALILGYQTRVAAYGGFILTLLFAISMFFFSGYRAPFNYSVLVNSGASLLLSVIPIYRWSIDYLATTKSETSPV